MTTQIEEATDLYGRIKPEALRQFRQFIYSRTPARLQDEMPAIVDNDIAAMVSAGTAPVNVDAPFVDQVSLTQLNCSLGNWNGTPTSRAYQWKKDGANVGTNSPNLTISAADYGHQFVCLQTATNAAGTSPPIVSNICTPSDTP